MMMMRMRPTLCIRLGLIFQLNLLRQKLSKNTFSGKMEQFVSTTNNAVLNVLYIFFHGRTLVQKPHDPFSDEYNDLLFVRKKR